MAVKPAALGVPPGVTEGREVRALPVVVGPPANWGTDVVELEAASEVEPVAEVEETGAVVEALPVTLELEAPQLTVPFLTAVKPPALQLVVYSVVGIGSACEDSGNQRDGGVRLKAFWS